jgi:hypothetical protein
MAGISTLVVSIFYLIPQMVGAGALVVPLFGLPEWIQPHMVGSRRGRDHRDPHRGDRGDEIHHLRAVHQGCLVLIVFSTVLVIAILDGGPQARRPSDPDYVELKTIETAYLTEDSFEVSRSRATRILQTTSIPARQKARGLSPWWS